MKPFTTEASNALEGRKLIPRTFSRRQAIGLLGGSLAGASLLSTGFAAPAKADVAGIKYNDIITLKCLGDKPGPRYLDGRTHNGTVGLAPHTNPPYTGTRWRVIYVSDYFNEILLRCEGKEPGPRLLDGRTHDGTVGLAPTSEEPYSGTRWKLTTNARNQPDYAGYFLYCKGKEPGPRYLDGRTDAGDVVLSPTTNKPFTGTRWSIEVVEKAR